MKIQSQVFSIVILTSAISLFFIYAGSKVKKANTFDKPKGMVLLAVILVETVNNFIKGILDDEFARKYGAYVGAMMAYILLSNYSSLFALPTPTGNFSVTIALSLIAWFAIQATAIRHYGFKGYISNMFKPFSLFFIINLFSILSPLISLSLRMFGNLVSGTVIMELVYSSTAGLSNLVPVIGKFNFIGVLVAPVLHAYFDIFVGFMQMFIFSTLVLVFIKNNIPEENGNLESEGN